VDRRPDPLWWTRPRHSRRFVFAVIVGAVAVYVALIALHAPGTCSAPGGGPCGASDAIVASVRPISQLSIAACAREMGRWGYSHSYAVQACGQGRRRAWFRAVITNTTGVTTAVLCNVDAYRRSGRRLARKIPLPVYIVHEPGVLFVAGHHETVVRWYFDPHDAPATITQAARFIASCRPNPNPPT
jgi:hypothetical protein